MTKYLTINYWMNKMGYRPTHWTDDVKDALWEGANALITESRISEAVVSWGDYQVTLSVKKMKK